MSVYRAELRVERWRNCGDRDERVTECVLTSDDVSDMDFRLPNPKAHAVGQVIVSLLRLHPDAIDAIRAAIDTAPSAPNPAEAPA